MYMILHFSDISKLTFTHVTHRRSPTRHTAYVHDAAVQDARCTKHHTTTPRGKSGSDTHSSLKQRGARAEASRHRQRRRRAAAAAPPMNYVRTRAHATPEPQLAPQPRIASPGAPSCRGSPCAGTASRQRESRHPPHPRPLVDPLHVHESRPIASLILEGEDDGPRRVTCRG